MTTTAPDRVSIRRAERADLLEVLRIEQAAFPEPWPYGAFAAFLGEAGFLVAVDEPAGTVPGGAPDGAVRGYVVADVVEEHGRTLGHVKDLAVHPDWRGRGLGSRLLSRGLGVVQSAGARRVKLEVREGNEAALALYRSFGFEPDHRVPGYYDDGEDALLLVAELGRGRRKR